MEIDTTCFNQEETSSLAGSFSSCSVRKTLRSNAERETDDTSLNVFDQCPNTILKSGVRASSRHSRFMAIVCRVEAFATPLSVSLPLWRVNWHGSLSFSRIAIEFENENNRCIE